MKYSILNIIHFNQWKLGTFEFVWPLVLIVLMDLILFSQNIVKIQVEAIPAYSLLSWHGNSESYMHKQRFEVIIQSMNIHDDFLSFNKSYSIWPALFSFFSKGNKRI